MAKIAMIVVDGPASSSLMPNVAAEPHEASGGEPRDQAQHQTAPQRDTSALRIAFTKRTRREHLHALQQTNRRNQKHGRRRPAQRLIRQLIGRQLPDDDHVNEAHADNAQTRECYGTGEAQNVAHVGA
jgi:hypothetical protein